MNMHSFLHPLFYLTNFCIHLFRSLFFHTTFFIKLYSNIYRFEDEHLWIVPDSDYTFTLREMAVRSGAQNHGII